MKGSSGRGKKMGGDLRLVGNAVAEQDVGSEEDVAVVGWIAGWDSNRLGVGGIVRELSGDEFRVMGSLFD